jgi:hypothetical protein
LPEVLVVAAVSTPVSRFRKVTAAAGTAAPLGSLTTPWIFPLNTDWA